ncbi:hypothetical protein GW17_00062251 [Ensete ventricosum]|nr:hypothetical protein GW17_00062251 [Ensete ventricosum]
MGSHTVINLAQCRTQCRVSIGFWCTVSKIQNSGIPNVFGHWKSYEHSFMKKHNGYKLYKMSSFNRFFVHYFGNSKYRSFPTYWAMRSHTSTVSRKNATIINFARSRVSIGFSSIISKIQNSSHSQRICA